jgi:hypothetical protein
VWDIQGKRQWILLINPKPQHKHRQIRFPDRIRHRMDRTRSAVVWFETGRNLGDKILVGTWGEGVVDGGIPDSEIVAQQGSVVKRRGCVSDPVDRV